MAMIVGRWSARGVAEARGGGGQVRGLAARRREIPPGTFMSLDAEGFSPRK